MEVLQVGQIALERRAVFHTQRQRKLTVAERRARGLDTVNDDELVRVARGQPLDHVDQTVGERAGTS